MLPIKEYGNGCEGATEGLALILPCAYMAEGSIHLGTLPLEVSKTATHKTGPEFNQLPLYFLFPWLDFAVSRWDGLPPSVMVHLGALWLWGCVVPPAAPQSVVTGR